MRRVFGSMGRRNGGPFLVTLVNNSAEGKTQPQDVSIRPAGRPIDARKMYQKHYGDQFLIDNLLDYYSKFQKRLYNPW